MDQWWLLCLNLNQDKHSWRCSLERCFWLPLMQSVSKLSNTNIFPGRQFSSSREHLNSDVTSSPDTYFFHTQIGSQNQSWRSYKATMILIMKLSYFNNLYTNLSSLNKGHYLILIMVFIFKQAALTLFLCFLLMPQTRCLKQLKLLKSNPFLPPPKLPPEWFLTGKKTLHCYEQYSRT